MESDLIKALTRLERDGEKFNIAYLDPPYEDNELYGRALLALASGKVLVDGGLLVVEHSKRVQLAEAVGRLRRYRELKQGDSHLSFYRAETT